MPTRAEEPVSEEKIAEELNEKWSIAQIKASLHTSSHRIERVVASIEPEEGISLPRKIGRLTKTFLDIIERVQNSPADDSYIGNQCSAQMIILVFLNEQDVVMQ
jgi:hypothetical protein